MNPLKHARLERSPEYERILSSFGSDAPINPELIAAYQATEYRVAASPPFKLLIGKYSEPLAELITERGLKSAAYITAYNPHGRRRTEKENRLSHYSLRQHLGNRVAALFNAEGTDPSGKWPSELGFLVLGLKPEDAKSIGMSFRQDSIVWAAEDAVPELVMLVDNGR